MKLPFLATSRRCHFWQLHKAAISGNFMKLPFLETLQSCHFWQLHEAAIFGNFTKLPFLETLQSCHFWQLHKAAICGNYNCCHIWQQLRAHFGKKIGSHNIPYSCHYWHAQLLQDMSITNNFPKLA